MKRNTAIILIVGVLLVVASSIFHKYNPNGLFLGPGSFHVSVRASAADTPADPVEVELKQGMIYQSLSADDKKAYDVIMADLNAHKELISHDEFPKGVNPYKIERFILNDNPGSLIANREFFNHGEVDDDLKPNYNEDASVLQGELNKAADSIVAGFGEGDARAKIKAIHAYLAHEVEFDYDQQNHKGRDTELDHTAYGALVNHKAVCDGYAAAFVLLAEKCGVEAMVVDGTATYKGVSGWSAWNVVKVDDKYYNLDNTWDANYHRGRGDEYFGYYMVGYTQFSKDHICDLMNEPAIAKENLEK
ncbi:MAG: hypothetical protein LBN08_03700 [Lactobacillales bacterium]|jgi:hypothetical protein|nr:hypothetical protein [Lactobacillales bacterium]